MMNIGMSTSCVYPLSAAEGFRFASLAGYDGVEVMVTRDSATQTADGLRRLMDEHQMPVLSIHAPVLLLTHFVWGRDPQIKLEKAAELAAEVGATSVVVHPPFRWQSTYAERFLDIVRQTANNTGVHIAVENMFPWKVGSAAMQAYSPGPDPRDFDCDAVTLDFSHASLGGRDSLEYAMAMGSRLRHIHLCDGAGSMAEGRILDEHLIPGHGVEPVAEVLQFLGSRSWDGSVIAEVNTRSARTEDERLGMLRETREFAAGHLAAGRAYRRSKHRTA
jgi:sugar phosphate isomerase/epimerase